MMLSVKDLISQSDALFSKRASLLSLWQELAEHFYPERADFTYQRHLGAEFVEYLMTSYPVLVRRDLGNAFSSILRPTQKEWFHIISQDATKNESWRWLQEKQFIQRREMYSRHSMFVRATKEGDHDYATFGQCVLSVTMNKERNGLLYRTWHLRDVAWRENEEGKIDTVFRKWNPTATDLEQLFGEAALSNKVKTMLKSPKRRYTEVKCLHVVMPTDIYAEGKYRTRWVSLHVDVENNHVIEEIGIPHFEYVIPRWQTVSGSQYAYSPATVVGLADARLIQAMARVLLEAGEKATNPPMLATEEVVRSGINVYAGGVTWIDAEYDGKLDDALRPLNQDTSGLPIGMEMLQDMRGQLVEAFYANKLSLPVAEHEWTAFETAQRIEEYIRQSLPLFEPMEMEYNGGICESTFDVLLANGKFGAMDDVPAELSGSEVEFRFESPLHDAVEKVKGQTFLQAKQMLIEAAELDPDAPINLDVHTAIRDSLAGIGVEAKWMLPEDVASQAVKANRKQRAKSAEMEQAAQAVEVAGGAAEAAQTAEGLDFEGMGA